MFTRLMLSLAATGIAPGSFYELMRTAIGNAPTMTAFVVVPSQKPRHPCTHSPIVLPTT